MSLRLFFFEKAGDKNNFQKEFKLVLSYIREAKRTIARFIKLLCMECADNILNVREIFFYQIRRENGETRVLTL